MTIKSDLKSDGVGFVVNNKITPASIAQRSRRPSDGRFRQSRRRHRSRTLRVAVGGAALERRDIAPAVSMRQITKRFGSVLAVDAVDFEVRQGQFMPSWVRTAPANPP